MQKADPGPFATHLLRERAEFSSALAPTFWIPGARAMGPKRIHPWPFEGDAEPADGTKLTVHA